MRYICTSIVATLVLAGMSLAATINVPADYTTIQAAVDAASDNDEIVIAPGTYTGTGDNVVDMSEKTLTLRASGTPQETIIDGEGARRVIRCDGSHTNIEGLTITNGWADKGGGIHCSDGHLNVLDCVFTNNTATQEGGGLYGSYATGVEVTNCIFDGNNATFNGGGIMARGSSWTISVSGCTFVNNRADGPNTADGGGGFNAHRTKFELLDCTFYGNVSTYGGAITCSALNNGAPVISNCNIYDNHAYIQTGKAGGGYHYQTQGEASSKPIISSTIFCNNTPFHTYPEGSYQDGGGNAIEDECDSLGGACCLDNVCYEFTQDDCVSQGGNFIGWHITCDDAYCDATWVVAQDGSGNFDSIQEAIVAADEGDVVLVTPGHYFENITFLGKAITVISSSPTWPELTTIDGGGTFDNTVVFAAGEDGDSVLDGFFITGGNSPLNGGGIYCTSSPTIRNCIISGNHADENGGGLYITGNPTFDTCIIHGNDADGLGNGMYISSSTANIIDCMFGASSSGIGEAVYAYGSGANFTGITLNVENVESGTESGATLNLCSTTWTNSNIENCNHNGLIITNSIADQFLSCTFSNNTATHGGGIYCEGGVTGAPVLDECIFDNNTADQDGGGIYCTAGSSPAITGCTITFNSAAWGGGITCDTDSSPTLTNCSFNGNTASDDGGGVLCSDSSSPTFTDCAISDNTAVWGGGIAFRADNSKNCSPTFTDCTISDNTSINRGGGIYSQGSINATITGCTISSNTANGKWHGGGGIYCVSDGLTFTDCMISDNTANYGGGIYSIWVAGPMVQGCEIMGNTAIYEGGGFYMNNSSPTLTECEIDNNTAVHGGGFFFHISNPTITNCAIANNFATGDGGGGFANENSDPTIIDCTISNNTANNYGGGIHCRDNSSPTMTGCTISDNTAINYNYGGGGISCDDNGNPTITECVIEGNSAANHGGGLFVINSTPILTNCPISNNTAGGDGGGIHNSDGGSPVLENCEFTGNQGVLGGGMYNGNNSSQEVANLTFTKNTATRGGGIYVADTNVDSMIDSCTFVGNIATADGGGLFSTATSCVVADSLFEFNAAAQGAGLYLEDGSILRSELRGNIASVAGGGLYSASAAGIYLQDSLICENEPDWIEGEWIDGTGNDFPVNCPTDCPGDYDSDGVVNVIDILGVIGDWGPCNPDAPCPSDFDGDGVVGVTDVLTVIGNWGPCA